MKTLWNKGIRETCVRAINDMYEVVSTSVRIQGRDTKDFFIIIGLHQGSTPDPYIITIILYVCDNRLKEELKRRLKTTG